MKKSARLAAQTAVLVAMILSGTGTVQAGQFIAATGGDHVFTNTVGGTDYAVHVFTTPGTNTFAASADLKIDVVIVGGGGGAGGANATWARGAGGGAGGLIFRPALVVTNGSYDIVVGAGGVGTKDGPQIGSDPGENGEDSTAFSLTALGGGGGGSRGDDGGQHGQDGGSGGGASKGDEWGTGGQGLQPEQSGDSGKYGWGNDGATNSYGGGGAGAHGDGIHGGDGLNEVTIDDVTYSFVALFGENYGEIINGEAWFAGGGAGDDGTGGKGGGGNGVSGVYTVRNAMGNTGGGGAGWNNTGNNQGGDGGSGIVMIRYGLPPAGTVIVLR